MRKKLALLLAMTMTLSLNACSQATGTGEAQPESTEAKTEAKTEAVDQYGPGSVYALYANDYRNQEIINVSYQGLDFDGLEMASQHYGSENYGDADVNGGCSITFAEYMDGTIGAVRNMDLQRTDFCSYQLMIQPGENVKFPIWALSYTGVDDKDYVDVLVEGMSEDHYKILPFQTTDAMSFGIDENGDKACLYCAVLMRSDQEDEEGNYIWTCSGTNPGAQYRCATQSVPILLTSQYTTVDEALKAVGAVDEDYKRIYPDDEPTIDVFTFNIETEHASNHWFECVAMEDATGHHGVLEFIDNHAIWHDNLDYSFNFFLQEEYLKDKDGHYIEDHGAGIGRYEATVPYLKDVKTISDHVSLMDGIRYSALTYYDEENGYIGYDYAGKPVDWRSEVSSSDVFSIYENMHDNLKVNTKEADEKYPLWANYMNTETGKIEKVDSYEYYKENKDHLKSVWNLEYVMQDENKEEVMNFIRWNGCFYRHLTLEEINATRNGWETFFKVLANPAKGEVTRWFNEDMATSDTITIADFITE